MEAGISTVVVGAVIFFSRRWELVFSTVESCALWVRIVGSYTAIKVWPHYQVLLVMTRGRSHMERSVTKFSLPSITGNPSPNLVQVPSITGRITSK